MSAPRSRPAIFPRRRSSICASPAPPRSSTIASRPIDNMRSPPRPASLAGPTDRIVVIDEDLGLSGSGAVARSGLRAADRRGRALATSASCSGWRCRDWRVTTPIGIGSSSLCGLSDTLIGDADGVYHPALFNDRLLLGLNRTVT